MFSLMDGFSSYNQSWVILDDQHNTTFIMSWGTYYYKVMPLKFKNMGATNQRAMNYFFHEIMEDQVDELLTKYIIRYQHCEVLEKVFQRLLKHNIRLNPRKCVFNITLGKLLGFIISKIGIEVNPKKVKAITSMPPPHEIKT